MKVREVHKRTAYKVAFICECNGEVMENCDWVCVINVEMKRSTGQYYLTFKRVKIRYRDPEDKTYINHPFVMGNKIQIMDDIHLDEPLYEDSLSCDFEGVDLSDNNKRKNATKRDTVKDAYDDEETSALFKTLNGLS